MVSVDVPKHKRQNSDGLIAQSIVYIYIRNFRLLRYLSLLRLKKMNDLATVD